MSSVLDHFQRTRFVVIFAPFLGLVGISLMFRLCSSLINRFLIEPLGVATNWNHLDDKKDMYVVQYCSNELCSDNVPSEHLVGSTTEKMWTCRRCAKPVFFAERKSSLGYEWHSKCLRCEECGKRLNPGQHAEHKGIPYCNIPCYGALFGPQLYGHGSRVESHASFGKPREEENDLQQGIEKSVLESKLKEYNEYYENKYPSNVIKCRERNGKLILEGSLRIFWDVSNQLILKEDNDDRLVVMRRKNSFTLRPRNNNSTENFKKDYRTLPLRSSKRFFKKEDNKNSKNVDAPKSEIDKNTSFDIEKSNKSHFNNNNDNYALINKENKDKIANDELNHIKKNEIIITNNKEENSNVFEIGENYNNNNNHNNDDNKQISSNSYDKLDSSVYRDDEISDLTDDEDKAENENRTSTGKVNIRKRTKNNVKLKRRCSINGHFYNRDTCVFTPDQGSVTSVWLTSLVNTTEVINLLLYKFKVTNKPQDFSLFILRDNGECRRIGNNEYPLLTRVLLGPDENASRVFILNKNNKEISNEVAQYLNFTNIELKLFLKKFEEEEMKEIERIRVKYDNMKKYITMLIQQMENESKVSQRM